MEDGKVNTTIIENICLQIDNILQDYPVWTHLNVHCLVRLNSFVAELSPRCQDPKLFSDYYDDPTREVYTQYQSLLVAVRFSMISGLKVTHVNIVTDTHITINDEVFLPLFHDQYYQIEFNVTCGRLLHSTIRNNTLKNLHLHLDSSIGSVNIKQNVLNGSGIKIFKGMEDPGNSISVENNFFQGHYERPALEFWNTNNISLKNNSFDSLQFNYLHIQTPFWNFDNESFKNHYFDNFLHSYFDFDDKRWNEQNNTFQRKLFETTEKYLPMDYYMNNNKQSSAIICNGCQIKVSDSAFKRIYLNAIIRSENCSVEMINTRLSEITPSLDRRHSGINMKNSSGDFSNLMFLNNNDSFCIQITDGEFDLENITLNGNIMDSQFFGMINFENSQVNLKNVTAVNNKGGLMSIFDSVINMSSVTWKFNTNANDGLWSLLFCMESHVQIDNSLFSENFAIKDSVFFVFHLDRVSAITISRSNFTLNKLELISLTLRETFPTVPDLKSTDIFSCRFEDNIIHTGGNSLNFIDMSSAYMNIYNSFFSNNTVDFKGGKGFVNLRRDVEIQFVNCTVSNNYGYYSPGFLMLAESIAIIDNCRFTNNRGSGNAGVIDISRDSFLLVKDTLFENNQCGVDGGAIKAYNNASLLITNSTFIKNKSFGSDGGAIFLGDRSQMKSIKCTFWDNTAAMQGGAVMVTDSSTFRDLESSFIFNTAYNYG